MKKHKNTEKSELIYELNKHTLTQDKVNEVLNQLKEKEIKQ